MAKKKIPTAIDVSGLSIADIMDMEDIYSLNAENTRKLANRLVSASNKRLRRLQKSDTPSPSLIAREDKKGNVKMFSIKGIKKNDVNKLRGKIRQLQNFLKSKTSTAKGYKEYRKDIIQRLGSDFRSKGQEKRFWKVYDKLKDEMGGELYEIYGSERVQKMLKEEISGTRSKDQLYERISKRLDQEYIRMQQEGMMDYQEDDFNDELDDYDDWDEEEGF